MVSLRDQIISKSQVKRIAVQAPAKARCVYFSTPHGQPYRSNQEPCNNAPEVSGQHGFLCKPHRLQQESVLESIRKNTNNNKPIVVNPFDYHMDATVIDGILKTEARAIARGKVTAIRFGSCAPQFKPDYVKVWERGEQN